MPSSAFRRVRSEEHTSELQSHSHLVCRLLLGKQTCARSEEHTSELQSHSHLVCRLLLAKTTGFVQLPAPHPARDPPRLDGHLGQQQPPAAGWNFFFKATGPPRGPPLSPDQPVPR